jgi:hypothetical protein
VSELQDDAQQLLAAVDERAVDERAYSRLTVDDQLLILALASRGKSQTEIAGILGCHPSSVSRVITKGTRDTTEQAKAYLKANALPMAESVVTKGNPDLHVKVLGKIDVVREDKVPPNTGGHDQHRDAWTPHRTAGHFCARAHAAG